MSNKFEQLLELLINEENDKAEQLFHEIVVEKSRDIYENLADSESAPADATSEEVKEEAKEETKEETKEEAKEEVAETEFYRVVPKEWFKPKDLEWNKNLKHVDIDEFLKIYNLKIKM